MEKIRILLAEDHELFRQGLATLLNAQADLEVVGQARDGFEVFNLTRDLRPDLVIMDISMPVCDGVEATRLIRAIDDLSPVRITMLTILEDDKKLLEAVEAGANAYLLKGISQPDFLDSIRSIAAGEAIMPPKLAARLLEQYSRLASRPSSVSTDDDLEVPDLTIREQEVLGLIATKMTDKEIAVELSVSVYTVKSHVRNILSKLHVANRRQAVKQAKRQGLLPDD